MVDPVVKMRPHPASRPISLLKEVPSPPGFELTFMVNNANLFMISAFFRFLTYVVGLLVVFFI